MDKEIPRLGKIEEIKVENIVTNKNQPRRVFKEEAIRELAESIELYGLIQPILVRRITRNKYEIVAGERRYRASKLAAREKIAAIVVDVDEGDASKLALIENIQREQLSPIEEAKAFRGLIEDFEISQKELSQIMGKSRSYISNSMRLLNLDQEILGYVKDEKLSPGHAKALLGLKKAGQQKDLAEEIVDRGLNVRQTEARVRALKGEDSKSRKDKDTLEIDSHKSQLEDELMKTLGTRVRLVEGASSSKLEIEYYTEEDLSRIYDLLIK